MEIHRNQKYVLEISGFEYKRELANMLSNLDSYISERIHLKIVELYYSGNDKYLGDCNIGIDYDIDDTTIDSDYASYFHMHPIYPTIEDLNYPKRLRNKIVNQLNSELEKYDADMSLFRKIRYLKNKCQTELQYSDEDLDPMNDNGVLNEVIKLITEKNLTAEEMKTFMYVYRDYRNNEKFNKDILTKIYYNNINHIEMDKGIAKSFYSAALFKALSLYKPPIPYYEIKNITVDPTIDKNNDNAPAIKIVMSIFFNHKVKNISLIKSIPNHSDYNSESLRFFIEREFDKKIANVSKTYFFLK